MCKQTIHINKDDVYNLLLKENDKQDVIYARALSSNQKKELELESNLENIE